MVAKRVVTALGTAAIPTSSPLHGQSAPREPTDVYIRRLAGLPAESAKGQIEIIDVGHSPLSTMLSIVGNRTGTGWIVSYACAASPNCAPDTDHMAMTYALPASKSAEVDRIIEQLRTGREPEGEPPSPNVIGGRLLVAINVPGFKRTYRRQIDWGKTLGRLESLLQPPTP